MYTKGLGNTYRKRKRKKERKKCKSRGIECAHTALGCTRGLQVHTGCRVCGVSFGYSHEWILWCGGLLVLDGRVRLRLVLGGRHGKCSPGEGLCSRGSPSGRLPGRGSPTVNTAWRERKDCEHVFRLSRRDLGARTKHSQLAGVGGRLEAAWHCNDARGASRRQLWRENDGAACSCVGV